jgi:hypothetical protein
MTLDEQDRPIGDRLRTDVKTLWRLVCNSFDARAVRARLTRFGSNHKFNLVVLSSGVGL